MSWRQSRDWRCQSTSRVNKYNCVNEMAHLIFLVMFYKITEASSQKWIVVSPKDNWSVFHRRVQFIQIDRIKWQRCADLYKGASGVPSNVMVHIRRTLRLVVAIREDSHVGIVCIYYNITQYMYFDSLSCQIDVQLES